MTTSPNPLRGPDPTRGPLVVSEANPRYFTITSDERKAVYLTGSHVWNNLHDGMGTTSSCCGAGSSSAPRPPAATSTCA
jgi:hypothetical protein